MNKILLLSASFIFSTSLLAQTGFELLDYQDVTVTNGQTITVTGTPNQTVIELGLHSKNKTQNNVDIALVRYEEGVTSGTQNYFCWYVCYLPVDAGSQPIWTAQDNLTMVPDSTYSLFHAYHRPQGNSGVSTYRYVFSDRNNPVDTLSVNIVFDVSPNSVLELNRQKSDILVYPNPIVNKGTIFYNLEGNSTEGKVVIHNMIGAKVKEFILSENEGRIVINSNELKSGAYFYTLIQNGSAIATKKLIISK